MGDPHGVDRAIEFAPPIVEKALQRRKRRRDIIVLPDVELQQGRMVRQSVVDLRRGQSIALQLQQEIAAYHNGPRRSVWEWRALCRRTGTGVELRPRSGQSPPWRKAGASTTSVVVRTLEPTHFDSSLA